MVYKATVMWYSSTYNEEEAVPMAGIENPKYAREIAELRRSNAAGIHPDRRTKRNRDRSSQRRNAIREQGE